MCARVYYASEWLTWYMQNFKFKLQANMTAVMNLLLSSLSILTFVTLGSCNGKENS